MWKILFRAFWPILAFITLMISMAIYFNFFYDMPQEGDCTIEAVCEAGESE